jgi:hypothetical protein
VVRLTVTCAWATPYWQAERERMGPVHRPVADCRVSTSAQGRCAAAASRQLTSSMTYAQARGYTHVRGHVAAHSSSAYGVEGAIKGRVHARVVRGGDPLCTGPHRR